MNLNWWGTGTFVTYLAACNPCVYRLSRGTGVSILLPFLAIQLKLCSLLPNRAGKGKCGGRGMRVSCLCNSNFAHYMYKAALLAEREINDSLLSRSGLLLTPAWGSH